VTITEANDSGSAPQGTRQWDKRGAATVIVVATVVLSFSSLRSLAEMCGFTGWLGWVWPICLDAVAYLATRIWLEKGAAYRFARALAVGAVSLSLVANGLVHGLTEYRLHPHWVVVVLVGAVPPLMLALVAHLLVTDQPASPAPAPAEEPAADVEELPADVPETPAELASPGDHQASANPEPDPLMEQARDVLAKAQQDGRVIGRTRLARELGVTVHQARQLLAEARRPRLAEGVASV
jgi:hypothetical protein